MSSMTSMQGAGLSTYPIQINKQEGNYLEKYYELLLGKYPSSFEEKDTVTVSLDAYNNGKAQEATIIYTDLAKTISSMTGGIMNGITLVIIAFTAISLIVSLIMISIITYTSVLERTKEIGILKALGACKKNITRVFDASHLTCLYHIIWKPWL